MGLELIVGVLILVIVAGWAVRQSREKRLRVRTLWIVPLLMAYWSFNTLQQDWLGSVWGGILITVGGVLGVALGAARGALTVSRVDRAKGVVYVQRTLWSLLLWIGVAAFKTFARDALSQDPALSKAGLTASTLLAYSLGMVLAHRAYMYFRYFKGELASER